jgi:hypothetical protein
MADTSFEGLWPVQLDILGPSAPLPERSTFQMRAQVTYENDAKQIVTPSSWSVTSTEFGSIDNAGLFTAGAVSAGTRSVQINCAFYHEESDTTLTAILVVTVKDIDTPPALVSISVVGKTEVEKNSVETYEVVARFDNNTTKPVTPASFTSSRPGIATIDTTGVAHFLKIRGSASVRFTATYVENNVTRTAFADVLVVDSSIYPVKGFVFGPAFVTERGRAAFGFDVLFENGKNQQVVANWHSTNEKAGHISCDGTFIANAVDGIEKTTIVASYEFDGTHTSASFELSVLDITVRPESLSIEGPSKIREGLVVQYYTTVQFTNGTRQAVNADLRAAGAAGFVDAGNQFHAARQVNVETPAQLFAMYEGLEALRTVDVIPATYKPVSCYIELRSPMHVGEYQALKFHVVYEDGSDLVLPAEWSISNEWIASITQSGVLHASQVVETAELVVYAETNVSGVELKTELMVRILDIRTFPTSIRIDGPDSVRANTQTNFSAVATFSDGSEQPVLPHWFCADDAVNIQLGAFKASVAGKYQLKVSYILQHETVTALKEITVL